MRAEDKQAFGHLLNGIFELYDKPLTPAILNIWWGVVERYDLAAVEYALGQHVRSPDEGQFMPKPNAIVKYLEGNSDDRALQAWALVSRSIGSIGQHNSAIFPDPLIHAVISDMGGWPKLCSTTTDELPFRAKEFENRYRSFLRHPPKAYPRVLTGLSYQHNSASGRLDDTDKPMLAGPVDMCKRVYHSGYKERKELQKTIGMAELNKSLALIGGG